MQVNFSKRNEKSTDVSQNCLLVRRVTLSTTKPLHEPIMEIAAESQAAIVRDPYYFHDYPNGVLRPCPYQYSLTNHAQCKYSVQHTLL